MICLMAVCYLQSSCLWISLINKQIQQIIIYLMHVKYLKCLPTNNRIILIVIN